MSSLWERLRRVGEAAVLAWRDETITDIETIRRRYDRRWAVYVGDMFNDVMRRSSYRHDVRVYSGTRLAYKHQEAVVNFYAGTVYQGDLSTDGRPLPDGTRGAIPIDPQLGDDAAEAELRVALAELWSAWNWRQNMTRRPMYGAALGDVLTTLDDDLARGFVYPTIVWPGFVTDIELDAVDNVLAYAVEYRLTQETAGRAETFTYRKEVDKEAFRYFRDGRPHDYYGEGAVVPNIYGFVPAIWDRHRVAAPHDVRGLSATDGTWQALALLNSHLSHGIAYQGKGFSAPIIVAGQVSKPGQSRIVMPRRATTAPAEDGTTDDENLDLIQGSENARIAQANFDVGQMLAIVEAIKAGIIEENPEGSFYRRLGEMSNVTAPGAERALGDAASRCRLARAGYDTQSVKLFQMALSMCGHRANAGDWSRTPDGRARPLSARQRAFLPYTLDSYHAGQMDFGISDRPIVLPTERERVDLALARESLQDARSLMDLGYDEDEARRIVAEREAALVRRAGLNDGFGETP